MTEARREVELQIKLFNLKKKLADRGFPLGLKSPAIPKVAVKPKVSKNPLEAAVDEILANRKGPRIRAANGSLANNPLLRAADEMARLFNEETASANNPLSKAAVSFEDQSKGAKPPVENPR